MTDPRCRTNSLADNGLSVKDRLSFWKQKDSDNTPKKLSSSPQPEYSPTQPCPLTPTNDYSPQSKSVSTIVSSVFSFKPFSSSRKHKAIDSLNEENSNERRSNNNGSNNCTGAVAATNVTPAKNNIIDNSILTNHNMSDNLQTTLPLVSNMQSAASETQNPPTRKSIRIADETEQADNSNATNNESHGASTSNDDNEVFLKFISKLKADPSSPKGPLLGSSYTGRPLSMSHDPSRHKQLSSSANNAHLFRSSGAPNSNVRSSIHSSITSTSSSRNYEKDRLFFMSNNAEEPTSPSASSVSGKTPRFIDIDKIIATVDQLKIPDHVQKQRQQRAQLKNSGVPSSTAEPSEEQPAAVERLLSSIDQLKEMESLQKNIEKLRSERVKKA